MRSFFSFFLASFLWTSLAAAQTTSPITDTSKKVETAKKKTVMTLRTLGMTPIYNFTTNDNAKIDKAKQFAAPRPVADAYHYPGEKHLANIRQYTFEGENSHLTISPDGRLLLFQARGIAPESCDQIYIMPLAGGQAKRVSTGSGRTACPCFIPGSDQILYSSTQGMYGGGCPPMPSDFTANMWPLYKAYDLYVGDTNAKVLRQITFDSLYYDAEASISPNGNRVVFTSTRSGAIDLYSMNLEGMTPRRLTYDEGYNGGATYSPDSRQIAFCASRPSGDELADFRKLQKEGLFKPTLLDIYVMDSDGSNKTAITHLGGVNCAPCWEPDGEHIIFSSNYLDPTSQNFDLFRIKKDGTGLERITYGGGFNGFPTFTPDGKTLVFTSARNARHPSDRNIFVADWVE